VAILTPPPLRQLYLQVKYCRYSLHRCWVVPDVSLDALEKKRNSCLAWASSHDTSVLFIPTELSQLLRSTCVRLFLIYVPLQCRYARQKFLLLHDAGRTRCRWSGTVVKYLQIYSSIQTDIPSFFKILCRL